VFLRVDIWIQGFIIGFKFIIIIKYKNVCLTKRKKLINSFHFIKIQSYLLSTVIFKNTYILCSNFLCNGFYYRYRYLRNFLLLNCFIFERPRSFNLIRMFNVIIMLIFIVITLLATLLFFFTKKIFFLTILNYFI